MMRHVFLAYRRQVPGQQPAMLPAADDGALERGVGMGAQKRRPCDVQPKHLARPLRRVRQLLS